jgi:lipopolysaccharide transport system permease protein
MTEERVSPRIAGAPPGPGPKKLARRRIRAASAAAGRPASAPRVIEPPRPGLRRAFAAVQRYRPAYFYFVRRFLRKRYGQTYLGYLWLVLPIVVPLLMGALVFGGILGVDVGPAPYFLYFIVASSAWHTFAAAAYFATRSLEISRSEVRRIYVPRLIPLVASTTMPLVNLVVYFVIAAGATAFYVIDRGVFYLDQRPATLLVPVALALLMVFGLACGSLFAPLGARARDVRRLAGYTLGFWYFLTPVIYPIDEIPSSWQFLASLNPVTAPIETVKYGLLGIGDVTLTGVVVFFVALVVVGAFGLLHFTASERKDIPDYY